MNVLCISSSTLGVAQELINCSSLPISSNSIAHSNKIFQKTFSLEDRVKSTSF